MLSPALKALRQSIIDQRNLLAAYGREPNDLSRRLLGELDLLDRYLDLDGFLQNLTKNGVITEMPPGPVVGSSDRCGLCNCNPRTCP
jgi:hypothetical protein